MTTPIKCPCTPDCPHRSCNCRELCWEFQEYDKQRMASYAERDKERRKARALSQYESPPQLPPLSISKEKGGPAQMTLLYIVFAAGLTRPACAIEEAIYYAEK